MPFSRTGSESDWSCHIQDQICKSLNPTPDWSKGSRLEKSNQLPSLLLTVHPKWTQTVKSFQTNYNLLSTDRRTELLVWVLAKHWVSAQALPGEASGTHQPPWANQLGQQSPNKLISEPIWFLQGGLFLNLLHMSQVSGLCWAPLAEMMWSCMKQASGPISSPLQLLSLGSLLEKLLVGRFKVLLRWALAFSLSFLHQHPVNTQGDKRKAILKSNSLVCSDVS